MNNAVVLGWAGILKPGKWRWLRALLWAVLFFFFLLLPQVAIPIGVWQLTGIPLQRFRFLREPNLQDSRVRQVAPDLGFGWLRENRGRGKR